MQTYELEHEKKVKLIQSLEKDQTQLIHENNTMSEQLYKLKSDLLSADKDVAKAVGDYDYNDII